MLKKFLVLLILPTSLLVGGCQTPAETLTSAENLQSEVLAKFNEIKTNVENVTTQAKDAYAALQEKKQQLEDMITKVNEAKAAMDKLMGEKDAEVTTEELTEKEAELQKTIDELQAELKKTDNSIEEAEVQQAVEGL
ncbi:MAG: hypothetical protein PHO48_01275 [Candidatus Gracilibacteria bacterium]|jgi:ABC-type transporter Mla subunit MlaD|nr:hypothetical protein [Candidatus Gracilibacteria bacterium]MDD5178792.1 hypothetical protein [Candidatus Gracilibacteria bacterium]